MKVTPELLTEWMKEESSDTDKGAEALMLSYLHWDDNVKDPDNQKGDSDWCACCQLYLGRIPQRCNLCPLKGEVSSQIHCCNGAWHYWSITSSVVYPAEEVRDFIGSVINGSVEGIV